MKFIQSHNTDVHIIGIRKGEFTILFGKEIPEVAVYQYITEEEFTMAYRTEFYCADTYLSVGNKHIKLEGKSVSDLFSCFSYLFSLAD